MTYDFSTLSPADFEDLARELIGGELKIRFEAFAEGPDNGIDGRHSKGSHAVILQAKHLRGSSFSRLKSQMKRERAAIDRLTPRRYILATSRPLTPTNKAALAGEIGPSLKTEADIFSPRDLNALLLKHPEIERSHIKLWLSSTAILDQVVRSAQHAFATITREEIAAKVRVYAQNPSFKESRDKLEAQHIVIISGPPGVGKTTLAEILSYAYIGEGWELMPIRTLDDGFASIVDIRKRIYFFDDFLGKISLDQRALSSRDTDLARFMKRIRNSPNARFILTTRATIYEEGRRSSEALSDVRLDISRYVLDVGKYTRRIKARILYNHLLVANTPAEHIRALWEGGFLREIVDHQNYNPRVIEWMTDASHVSGIAPQIYGKVFLDALSHPHRLWDTAFRHLSKRCQHLLFALFFSAEYGVRVDELRTAYNVIHPHLCRKYGEPFDPKDYDESLRILESGFVSLARGIASFINPSVRDYLSDYLDDISMLFDFAAVCPSAEWSQSVWKHGTRNVTSTANRRQFALTFAEIASKFLYFPIWVFREDINGYQIADLTNSERIQLLLTWGGETEDIRFAGAALQLARTPVGGFRPWRDGRRLVELASRVGDPDYYGTQPYAAEMRTALEEGLLILINEGMASDDLEVIAEYVEEASDNLSSKVGEAVTAAIRVEFEEVEEKAAAIDSESTLEDHASSLKKLGARAGIPESVIEGAVSIVKNRITTLQEESATAGEPSVTGAEKRVTDKFDDVALLNLFAPLVAR